MTSEDVAVESIPYNDDGLVESEVVITAGEQEFVVVNKRNHDQLEVYQREPGEELPFVKLSPDFLRNSDWPDPPENVDVDPITGSVSLR